MSTPIISSWTPPPDSWLNITADCAAAAYWLASFVKTNYHNTTYHDASMAATFDYVLSVMPDNITQPDFGQALAWYDDLDPNSTTWEDFYDFPRYYCSEELCKELDWQGDQDLAGIGAMITYYLAAFFSTMYFVVLVFPRLRKIARFIDAFEESLNTFIDAALLFAISMLVAATYRHGSSIIHPDKTHSIYGLINSTYVSAFVEFPPLLLQIVAQNLRRRRIRLFLWFLVIIFSLTVAGIFFNLRESYSRVAKLLDRDSATTELIWADQCAPGALEQKIETVLTVAQTILGVNISWWLYCARPSSFHHPLKSKLPGYGALRRTRAAVSPWVQPINGIVCCAMMWVLLGMFTRFRLAVFDAMGLSNQDGQWSFGQVLSLATWVPVALDLATIRLYGAKAGLEGKVSQHYNIVAAPEKDEYESAEMQAPGEQEHLKVGDTSYTRVEVHNLG
ncbi:C6 zinc finger domain containing protein [Pleurostoma richardsiae]|uniref:C6 zinc finger domain containing protein n=1 Tax=Pleurostoma richardsiae TaxID=41990 RepID=A0AA38RAQ6_9PEZI|nr:C6 zinc finger domain containing protein [Pleurostoma richardsiae]